MEIPGVFPTELEPEGEPVGTAVVVPGRGYSPHGPLLFFAGLTLVRHGWRVEQHWWDPPAYETDEQTLTWVRGEVEPALPTSGRLLVVGKSLGTWAAPLAAERRLPAVWLTPVLVVPEIADAIAANPAPQLLVGGTDDDLWDVAIAGRLTGENCDVLEIPDGDHILMTPGEVARGVEAHADVVRALGSWLARLPA